MAELRIGTAISEPAIGTLKVGSADVQEIYLGTNKIWPNNVPPGEVQLGNLIWQTANYNELEGGNIAFANNIGEAWNYYESSTPAAIYFGFGEDQSDRGYLYNAYAARTITPPSGFRLPTAADFTNLYNYLRSQSSEAAPRVTNAAGGNPNFWGASVQANPEFGKSGFNAIMAGYIALNSSTGWTSSALRELFWDQTTANNDPISTRLFALIDRGYVENNNILVSRPYSIIRFCKDA